MKKLFFGTILTIFFFSSQTQASEEIQLAAAIGMPPVSQSGDDSDGRSSSSSSSNTAALSTRAMVGIGIGAAVLIGVVSSGSSDSTSSH